ncbi:MAG: lactate utilization protein [Acidobacteria bacterium]|nr:lactate utilization protein [Acidobacteriota bacterium]MBU4306213.1 lactate utilization protein [Acidobacteriota bacterium]MBU4404355.1 lactate utilization protein [Acidobacteriota bacterium]MCG2811499.1 lactate utilization protein [Candidatus Aminicenantes bacterium]
MKEKTDHKKASHKLQAQQLIQNFKKRGFEGIYCDSSAQAVQEICRLIPAGSLVGLGGSETILESGLIDALRRMDIRLLDRYKEGVSKEAVDEMRRQGLQADIFICSSNAISADGKLVNIDGTGNRVAALIYGPEKVIVMAGMNKVASDVQAAIVRVKNQAAPPNSLRVGVSTPCSLKGFCQDPNCQPPNRICCQLVISEASMTPGRITVVMVGETLGY